MISTRALQRISGQLHKYILLSHLHQLFLLFCYHLHSLEQHKPRQRHLQCWFLAVSKHQFPEGHITEFGQMVGLIVSLAHHLNWRQPLCPNVRLMPFGLRWHSHMTVWLQEIECQNVAQGPLAPAMANMNNVILSNKRNCRMETRVYICMEFIYAFVLTLSAHCYVPSPLPSFSSP